MGSSRQGPKLHDLAMDVVNHGMKGRAPALFDLATEIEDQLSICVGNCIIDINTSPG